MSLQNNTPLVFEQLPLDGVGPRPIQFAEPGQGVRVLEGTKDWGS